MWHLRLLLYVIVYDLLPYVGCIPRNILNTDSRGRYFGSEVGFSSRGGNTGTAPDDSHCVPIRIGYYDAGLGLAVVLTVNASLCV